MVEYGNNNHQCITVNHSGLHKPKTVLEVQDENAPQGTRIFLQMPLEHEHKTNTKDTTISENSTTTTNTTIKVEEETNTDGESKRVAKPRGGYKRKIRASNFVRTLRQMIEDEELLTWSDDGKKFNILDIHSFEANVLPRYFSHRRYQSFQRQLNYFDFVRCESTRCPKRRTQGMVFANENFCRDDPEREALVVKRQRKAPSPAVGPTGGMKRQHAEASTKTPSPPAGGSKGTKRQRTDDSRVHAEETHEDRGQRRIPDNLSLLAHLASCLEDKTARTEGGGREADRKTCHHQEQSDDKTPVWSDLGKELGQEGNSKDERHRRPQVLSIEEVKQSLPPLSCVRDPTKFHKSSEIDRHGVRFKIVGQGGKWRWKCRYCSQTILVGHGAPNTHLKKLHPEVSVCGRKKVLHGVKEESEADVSPCSSPPTVKVEHVERCGNVKNTREAVAEGSVHRSDVKADAGSPEQIAVGSSRVKVEESKGEDLLSQKKTQAFLNFTEPKRGTNMPQDLLSQKKTQAFLNFTESKRGTNMPHSTESRHRMGQKRRLDQACPRLLLESTKRDSSGPLEQPTKSDFMPPRHEMPRKQAQQQSLPDLRSLLESTKVQSKRPRLKSIHAETWQSSLRSLLESSKPGSIPQMESLISKYPRSPCLAF